MAEPTGVETLSTSEVAAGEPGACRRSDVGCDGGTESRIHRRADAAPVTDARECRDGSEAHTGEHSAVEFRFLGPCPVPWRHPLKAAGWLVRAAWGTATLVVVLAILAAIPLLNFVALGYLLDAQGRVARSGRWRAGAPLLEIAPRLGSILLGVWVWLLPVRLLAGAAADAHLIDPGGTADVGWHRALGIVSALVGVHLLFALAYGGSPSSFVRPVRNIRWVCGRLRNGRYWSEAADAVRSFLSRFQIRYHAWLGVRGFVGGLAWLLVPTILFAAAKKPEGGAVLATLLGGGLLMLVISWLPFLEARFAAENRLRAMFEWREVRRLFTRAPLAWWFSLAVLLILSLPLYLLKIALPPQDAMWMATTVFIASIYPSRLLVGWAYHRAVKRERPAWWVWRWLARLALPPLLAAYVFLLFFTRHIDAAGADVLFQHHAFLLPSPF